MTVEGLDTIRDQRIDWLDNLRTFMIFLVVLLHAGLVYESSGLTAFFWIVDDPSTNDLSGILNLIADIFVMPTIFFISGFLVIPSMRHQQGSAFLKSKFKRLMIPWAVAALTLLPLYKIIFLYSRNLPQEHWSKYFHWSNGIWGQNWLWFLPVLFLFNLLYLPFSKLIVDIRPLTLKKTVWSLLIIALTYSVAMDLLGFQGWTKTILVDFQNERILIYFLVFLLGAHCYKLKVLKADCRNKKLFVILAGTAWIPVNLYLFAVIHSILHPGSYLLSEIGDVCLIHFSFLLSLGCLLYLVVFTFRRYLNRQVVICRELNKNSYTVYIIHVVVMGFIAVTLLSSAIPSILKHLVLVLTTLAASNVAISLCRRVHACLLTGNGITGRRLTHKEMSG